MKVIERKEPQPSWPREMLCQHCGSRLAVEASDVKFPGQRDYDGKGWFTCAVCLRINYLTPTMTSAAGDWLRIERARQVSS